MNFDLSERTSYLIVSGSHSYGGHGPDSDYDLRGWCIPPKSDFLTFKDRFQQDSSKHRYDQYPFLALLRHYIESNGYRVPPDDEIIDHCIYSIHKFFRLTADCNPNLIENLYVDEEDVLLCNEWGRRVRENRELFLSARAKHTFTGYAVSQLKRINTHRRWLMDPPERKPERSEYGLPDTSVIPADQRMAAEKLIDSQVREWLLQDADILGSSELALLHGKLTDFVAAILSSKDMVVTFSDERKLFDAARLAAMKQLDMSDNYVAVMQAEKKFRARQKEWKQYQEWKANRNPERAKLEAEYGYDCYLDDTEFLTDSGWKRYDEISDDHELATLNQESGRVEFQHFTERVEKPFTGAIAVVNSRHSQCAVTMNHRMWVSPVVVSGEYGWSRSYVHERSEWQIKKMSELLDGSRTCFHVRVAADEIVSRGDDATNWKDDYLVLAAAYVSEGCVGKRASDGTPSTLRISQKKGGDLEKFMDKLMENRGSRWKIRRFESLRDEEWRTEPCLEIVWTISDRKIAKEIARDFGSGSLDKRLPRWTMDLIARERDLFIETMVAGDGTQREHSRVYYTASKRLADDVQAMCIATGLPSHVLGPYDYDDDRCPMYQVYIADSSRVAFPIYFSEWSNNFSVENVTDARIVCFTVPNEILITRRNGRVAIQGNTKHGMQLVRLLLMGKELLTKGYIVVKRPDRQFFLDVRDGRWSYERIIKYLEEQDAELGEIYKSGKYVVPHKPDIDALDRLCQGIIEEALAKD